MKRNLVSIVMPAYNARKTISESIESVLMQSYTNFELIIVDDYSSDDTARIIEGYLIDPRVKFLMSDKNGGVASARNKAIVLAKGKYLAFLDSDDVWMESKLEVQLRYMESSGLLCCHTSYCRMNSSMTKRLSVVDAKEIVTFDEMLTSNYIGNLTGIYDAFALGKFYQSENGHEDYLMWLNVISETKSIGVPEVLAMYRVLDNSLSSNKFKAAIWHYRILKNEVGLEPYKRYYCFFIYILKAIIKRI